MVAVPARRCSLQKSVGERLASNTLARRAPKRATARVNSGLGRSDCRRWNAGESFGRRDVASRTGPDIRSRIGLRPTVAWERHRAVIARQRKRRGGRGTGAVMATGSYEGSPLMEGTSDHHEPSTFTSRRSRWSWRLPHTSKARAVPKRTHVSRRDGEGRAQAGERGRGDRGVRGTVVRGLRGKKTPTLSPSLRRNTNLGGAGLRRTTPKGRGSCRSTKAVRASWKRTSLRSSRIEPKLGGAPTRGNPR